MNERQSIEKRPTSTNNVALIATLVNKMSIEERQLRLAHLNLLRFPSYSEKIEIDLINSLELALANDKRKT